MSERPDLGKAMREALPVYEASPSLQAWAREEARKLHQESSPQSEPLTRPARSRVWRLSHWPIAAGLVIAAAAGWGAGVAAGRRHCVPEHSHGERVGRCSRAFALAWPPHGCPVDGQAHGEAVVRRQDGHRAAGGRSHRQGISTARREARLRRWSFCRGPRLRPSPAHDQRVRLA